MVDVPLYGGNVLAAKWYDDMFEFKPSNHICQSCPIHAFIVSVQVQWAQVQMGLIM